MANALNFDTHVLFPPEEWGKQAFYNFIAKTTQDLYQNTSPPLFLNQRELEDFAFAYYEDARKDVEEFIEIRLDDVKRTILGYMHSIGTPVEEQEEIVDF